MPVLLMALFDSRTIKLEVWAKEKPSPPLWIARFSDNEFAEESANEKPPAGLWLALLFTNELNNDWTTE